MSEKKAFGTTEDGKQASLYTIRRGACEADLTDFGASLVAFRTEDKDGRPTDVVLGYDDVRGYEGGDASMGGSVGRNANRIDGASFSMNGKIFKLDRNEGENNLHSGWNRYEKRIWKTEGVSGDGTSITFSLYSPDGDQGFPGNLVISVTYSFPEEGALQLRWRAQADQDTVCNPTNHSYFNLNGQGSGTDICGHQVQIFAEQFTPVRKGGIPTGEQKNVEGTPFDFRSPKEIGEDIESADEQLKLTGGYDHNYVLTESRGQMRRVAVVFAPETGLKMDVSTDEPGLQFYTGNFLKKQKGKAGAVYDFRSGFAMETQYFPNAVNLPQFAQPVLRAGEAFQSVTVYRFSRVLS